MDSVKISNTKSILMRYGAYWSWTSWKEISAHQGDPRERDELTQGHPVFGQPEMHGRLGSALTNLCWSYFERYKKKFTETQLYFVLLKSSWSYNITRRSINAKLYEIKAKLWSIWKLPPCQNNTHIFAVPREQCIFEYNK